jgi:hypothetical protein
MRNVSEKNILGKIKKIYYSTNFSFEKRAINEIMWENIEKPVRPQMTIWGTHIACGMPKATNTLSEYVIHIAFPPLQWLHKCASLLRYSTERVILYKVTLDLSAESSVALLCSGYCLRVQTSVIFNTRFLLA